MFSLILFTLISIGYVFALASCGVAARKNKFIANRSNLVNLLNFRK